MGLITLSPRHHRLNNLYHKTSIMISHLPLQNQNRMAKVVVIVRFMFKEGKKYNKQENKPKQKGFQALHAVCFQIMLLSILLKMCHHFLFHGVSMMVLLQDLTIINLQGFKNTDIYVLCLCEFKWEYIL